LVSHFSAREGNSVVVAIMAFYRVIKINVALCRDMLDDRELLLFQPEKGTGILLPLHDEFQNSRYISEFRENTITIYTYHALIVFQPRLKSHSSSVEKLV